MDNYIGKTMWLMNRRTGGFQMIEQEWMKFASTGSIQDYLSYKCHQEAEGIYGDATAAMTTDRENLGRSVKKYGAEHSADWHSIISSPSGRI